MKSKKESTPLDSAAIAAALDFVMRAVKEPACFVAACQAAGPFLDEDDRTFFVLEMIDRLARKQVQS